MVGKTGFEPATTWSQTRCSTKLSHFPIKMVSPRGVEPLTFWSVVKRSIQLSYEDISPNIYIRKPRRQTLKMVASVGIEPTTPRFSVLCSANWAMKPQWRFRRELNPRSLAWQASVITATPRNHWLREKDLNLRPLGYEPNELPDCSIPRYWNLKLAEEKGFEPLRRFPDLPVFKTGPFNQTWVFLHIFYKLVPQIGLEPIWAFTLAGF